VELVYARETAVAPQVAIERAGVFLLDRGYRPAGGGPEEPRFERGRALAGLYTMSRMDRLHARLTVTARATADGCELGLRYRVDTLGQLITATNRAFWDVEVAELVDRVCDREGPDRWGAFSARARRDALLFALLSLAVAVVCGAVTFATGWLRYVSTR